MDKHELGDLLERLHDKYNCVDFIEHDPISIPHRFTAKQDIEIAGLLAATIAWGNRKAIVKSASRMMEYLDNSPYDFIMNATTKDLATLQNYVHRTFNGGDLTTFVLALRNMCELYGSVGGFFEQSWDKHKDIKGVLSQFRTEFFAVDHAVRTQKHVSSIDKGASCKRLNMYLRWMVRSDQRGVDFGLWNIPSSALYLPLDVHSGNMGRALGLLERTQNDWKAVDQITTSLRTFDPADPVKYDFSLFGAGISGFLKP